MSAQPAREQLEGQGIEFTEAEFLRSVRDGRIGVVQLFLAAGVSPNAVAGGETAIEAAARSERKEIVGMLLAAGADSSSLVDALHAKQKAKDKWEKLASLSGLFTFVSSLLIAGVGWYFTYTYNQHQLDLATTQANRDQQLKADQNRLTEMQTVEKMIPHLVRDERSKQAALLAISVLASSSIASRMAELYGGQGSVNALTQIAAADSGKPARAAVSALTGIAARKEVDATPAREALETVLAGREKAIVSLLMGNQAFCNGFLADARGGWIVTPGYCLGASGRSDTGKTLAIQTADGKALAVKSSRLSDDGLVALIQVDAAGLPELSLSPRAAQVGEPMMRLAYDLGASKPRVGVPSIALGHVVSVGKASLVLFSGRNSVETSAITLEMPAESKVAGSAGGPILDREGNVACMVYQGEISKSMHQCLPAATIANALAAAKRN